MKRKLTAKNIRKMIVDAEARKIATALIEGGEGGDYLVTGKSPYAPEGNGESIIACLKNKYHIDTVQYEGFLILFLESVSEWKRRDIISSIDLEELRAIRKDMEEAQKQLYEEMVEEIMLKEQIAERLWLSFIHRDHVDKNGGYKS